MNTTVYGFCITLFPKDQNINIKHVHIRQNNSYKVCVFFNTKNTDYLDFICNVRDLAPVKVVEYKPFMVSQESTFNSLVEYFCEHELQDK